MWFEPEELLPSNRLHSSFDGSGLREKSGYLYTEKNPGTGFLVSVACVWRRNAVCADFWYLGTLRVLFIFNFKRILFFYGIGNGLRLQEKMERR